MWVHSGGGRVLPSEVASLLHAWFSSLRGAHNQESKLAWFVLLATLPIIPAGLIANVFEEALRSPLLIAGTTIAFGLLLALAAKLAKANRDEYQMVAAIALMIGLAQCLALIPGTSRSGITITAALLLGLTPLAAARFSFLLSIPVIVLAGCLKTTEWIQLGMPDSGIYLVAGAGLAAVSAAACIHLFLIVLERVGMLPFVLYRLALGGVLLWMFV